MPAKKISAQGVKGTKPSSRKTVIRPMMEDVTVSGSGKKAARRPYALFVLLIAMALSAAYLAVKNMKPPVVNTPSLPEVSSQPQSEEDRAESIVQKVSRHIIVNENEDPYIASVNNVELVRQKNPIFYQDAQPGDVLLIWSDKAVLYNEATDRLVAVATAYPSEVNVSSTEMGATMADEKTDIVVEVRNGTRVAGAASKLQGQLVEAGLQISAVGDAAAIYDGTRIIDLTGGKAQATLASIQTVIAGTVTSTIPASERGSKADVLVIIGR